MYERQFNWLDKLQKFFIVDNKQIASIIMRKISIQNQGSTYIIIWNSKTIIHNFSFYALLGCQSDINTTTFCGWVWNCIDCTMFTQSQNLCHKKKEDDIQDALLNEAAHSTSPLQLTELLRIKGRNIFHDKNLINRIVAWLGWVYHGQSDCQNERGGRHMKNLHFWAMPEFLSSPLQVFGQ